MTIREPNGPFTLAGDWHSQYFQAEKAIRLAYEAGHDTVVQLGDFGIWVRDEFFLGDLNRYLEKRGMHLYFLDGNHENFPRLFEYPENEDGTRTIRDNITYLPRNYRFEWFGLTFHVMGGAASIDKGFREEGKDWWPEEAITQEDIEKALTFGKADIMLCHDSPYGAPNVVTDSPLGQHQAAAYFGDEALAYCTEHRLRLKQITDHLTPRILFHGHYHRKMDGYYYHPDGTKAYVEGLDEGARKPDLHIMEFDPVQIKFFIEQMDLPEVEQV